MPWGTDQAVLKSKFKVTPDRGYFTVLERHLTLAVPLFTQEYKWELESC